MSKVKYGLYGAHIPPIATNAQVAQFYEQAGLDFIAYSDQTAFTIPRSIWSPDLVAAAEVVDVDWHFDPFVLMAQAAMVTDKIELGVMACDVLRRSPSVLAQAILGTDHISQGRAHFYLGSGEQKHFRAYGLTRSKPFTHLDDAFRIILKLIENNEPVDYEGKIWNLKSALMTIPPYENKPPKIGLVGGGKARELAGQIGMGWGTFLPACGDPETVANDIKIVKEQAESAGTNPDDLIFQASFQTVTEHDDAIVQKAIASAPVRWDTAAAIPSTFMWKKIGFENPLGENWAYARDLAPTEWSREEALAICDKVPLDAVRKLKICGTPKEVADRIQPYIEAGINYVWAGNYCALVSSGGLAAQSSMACLMEVYNHLREMNSQEQIPLPTL